MSGWNVKWDEVSGQDSIIPEGTYTLEVAPGARFNEQGSLKASASVVDGGEFTGKRVFFSYPNPDGVSNGGKSFAWSKTAFKRLITALGEDPQEGEPEDAYLNRVAGNRFRGQIRHSKPNDQYPNAQAELNLFNVGPAA
jgi:hypothetical protein